MDTLPTETGVVDVGTKYTATGQVLPFYGNTVLRHLNPGNEAAVERIVALREKLQATSANPCWAWLPTDSYHMTMFGGANDLQRVPGLWPAGVLLQASQDECDAVCAARLRNLEVPTGPFRLRATGFYDRAVSLHLTPVSPADHQGLWELRRRLAEALGIHPPDFGSYTFHISLAYLIQPLSAQQLQERNAVMLEAMQEWQTHPLEVVLGAPQFCLFKDMNHFAVQFELGQHHLDR